MTVEHGRDWFQIGCDIVHAHRPEHAPNIGNHAPRYLQRPVLILDEDGDMVAFHERDEPGVPAVPVVEHQVVCECGWAPFQWSRSQGDAEDAYMVHGRDHAVTLPAEDVHRLIAEIDMGVSV